MKKITVLALLVVIVLSFGFVWLKLGSVGEEDNYFNQNLRDRIAVFSLARGALNLNWNGDARADYLGDEFSSILFEVDSMDGLRPAEGALEFFAQKVEEITGKQTSFLISDSSIPPSDEVDKDDLLILKDSFKDFFTGGETAVVYLLYATYGTEEEEVLGSTLQEDGIVLFKDELVDFTQTNREVLYLYEASTALHEFGHQLGLDHNDQPNCLMNEEAEEGNVARQISREVLVDFCEFEKKLIEKQRVRLIDG